MFDYAGQEALRLFARAHNQDRTVEATFLAQILAQRVEENTVQKEQQNIQHDEQGDRRTRRQFDPQHVARCHQRQRAEYDCPRDQLEVMSQRLPARLRIGFLHVQQKPPQDNDYDQRVIITFDGLSTAEKIDRANLRTQLKRSDERDNRHQDVRHLRKKPHPNGLFIRLSHSRIRPPRTALPSNRTTRRLHRKTHGWPMRLSPRFLLIFPH